MVFDNQGRLSLVEIKNEKASEKMCQVTGKTALVGGKIQYHLHDGRNLISDKKMNLGDSLLLSLPKPEIKSVFELKTGCWVFLTKGKHRGECGQLKSLNGEEATYLVDGNEVSTLKKYLFVLSEKPSWVSSEDNKKADIKEDKKSSKKVSGESQ